MIHIRKILLSLLTVFAGATAEAQDIQFDKIRLLHTAVQEAQLPKPGEPLKLVVVADGTTDYSLDTRLVISLDGSTLEFPMKGELNLNDQPTFSTVIPAPLAEASYQFAIFDKGLAKAASGKFTLRRSCLMDLTETDITLTSKEPEEKAQIMFDQIQGLNHELTLYQQIIENLEALAAEQEAKSNEG